MVTKDSQNGSPGGEGAAGQPQPVKRPMSKTPMFTARHAARYERQDLIKEIDASEGTNLICYVGGYHTEIDRDDIIGFVDLLHNIPEGEPIDLLLHTCGGDVDACEKLVSVVHAKVIDSPFRVIIPDMAKSAGTLMALGGNTIVMSDTSELGMIDPQFPMRDNQGNEFWHSVIGYLDAHEEHTNALLADPKNQAALLALDHFDAKVVKKFQGIRDRTRTFAEDLLKRRGLPASTISEELMSSKRWRTHGQPINHADAAQLGLAIEYVPTSDPRWMSYWKLYCLQRLEVGETRKIFESAYVSQVVGD
jgi:ClpP class serine protease